VVKPKPELLEGRFKGSVAGEFLSEESGSLLEKEGEGYSKKNER